MDWMLTDDGTRAWARDAFRETRDGEWPDVNTIADCVIDEAARAAVKKVMEWMEENNQATEDNLSDPAIDGEGIDRGWSGYRIYLGEVLLRIDQVAALKAAGEGE